MGLSVMFPTAFSPRTVKKAASDSSADWIMSLRLTAQMPVKREVLAPLEDTNARIAPLNFLFLKKVPNFTERHHLPLHVVNS